MKFLQILGRSGYSSFTSFEFDYHDASTVCLGDQVWSNGHEVEVADYIDEETLSELLSLVENKKTFKGALRRLEIGDHS